MTRNQASAASDHEIRFTTPTGVDASSDTITITFPSGFSLGTVSFADVDLFHGPTTGFETNETLAAAAAAGVWGTSVSGNAITFTAPTNAGAGEITAGDKVVVRIGINAAGGSNQVANPSTSAVYSLSIGGTFGDAGSVSISIAANDKLSVSLTVPAPSTGLTGGGSGGGGAGVDGTPPSISGIQARNITQTSVEIVWTTDEAANSAVNYGLTNTYGSGTVSHAAFTSSHSISLSGLSPNTIYHFRINSSDSANNMAASADATFRTLEPVRMPVISNVRAISRTDSSAAILWDTDIPTTSRVEYGTSTLYGFVASSEALVTSHALVLSGLDAGSSYYYRVASGESGGLTATSSGDLFLTTPDTTPPSNVFGFAASTDAQRVLLSWTIPTDPDVDHVTIVARTDRPPLGPTDGRIVYLGNGTSSTDSGLARGMLGYYAAYVLDRAGNPSSGSFLEATLQGYAITAPTILLTAPESTQPPLPSTPSSPSVFMLPIAPTSTGVASPIFSFGIGGTTTSTMATTTEMTLFVALTSTAATLLLPSPTIESTTTSQDRQIAIPTVKPHFYYAGSHLELEQDENGTFSLLPNRPVLLRISTVGLPAAPVSGSVGVNGSTYGLSRSPDGMSYEASFIPGIRIGEIAIVTTIQLANEQRMSIRQTSHLVGFGRVREKVIFGRGLAVVGATILIDRAVDRRAMRWDPSGTNQKNPAITAADGSFGFVVPNGRYVVRVSKGGYRPVSKEINVSKNVISEIIELTQAPKPILSVIDPEAPLLKNIAAVAEQVQIRVQSPENQAVTKAVVAPTVATVAVVNAASAVSAFNLFSYLRFFLTQPLLLFSRKKRRKWGVVFNSLSKRPIDLAIVRLVHAQTNLVIQTRITDALGRYTFIVPSGAYRLQVMKPQFIYPTVVMQNVKEDVGFLDLYHNEVIAVNQPSTLTPNIPLDPVVKEETPKAILLKQTLRKVQRGIGVVSTMVSVGAVFVVPTLPMAGFAMVQVALYLLFRRLALPPKPKGWGIVFDQETQKRLGRTVVRIFNKKYNKLLETQMTDENGRYGFVVGKDVYYLIADRPEYERYVSPVLDLINAEDNLIDHKISLKKKGAGSPQVLHSQNDKQ